MSMVFMSMLVTVSFAHAQSSKWPDKPARIVVASGAGGIDDLAARQIAPRLGEVLGQPFIVENRPGAGGLIGQTHVLKAPPDGYTLLLAGGSMAGAHYVNANARYDVLRDFTPISLLVTTQFVMVVHPGVPARNLSEYIALARSQAGKMTYAMMGVGQIPFWSALLFNSMAGIKALEVAYKDGGAARTDVISGRIDYVFTAAGVAAASRGKLRALGVTGTARSHLLPDVPTIAEAALPGYEMPGWASIMGPAGMRKDVVEPLNAAIRRTLALPEIRDRMHKAGVDVAASTPDELLAKYADWVGRFGEIAKEHGIRPK